MATSPTTSRPRRRTPAPTLRREQEHWNNGAVVAGVDEVGCGSWAGPVTYAAVVLPRSRRMYNLRDSKMLAPRDRERLAARLHRFALGVGIGHAGNDEIDRLGLSLARRLAARRAVDALPLRPEVILLDGSWDFLADYGTHNERIVRGDAHCASIAAASIVAKVTRDRLMTELAPGCPAYDFSSNKGYPSPAHRAALERFGPCDLHRRSWTPIAALAQLRMAL